MVINGVVVGWLALGGHGASVVAFAGAAAPGVVAVVFVASGVFWASSEG